MKKLLLLSALLIFACSSDDSSDNNNNSNQNFLQKYDGVTWEVYDWMWISFNPIGYNQCILTSNGTYKESSDNWGENVNGDYTISSIIENSTERLVIKSIDLQSNGETYSTFETTNNGNSLEVFEEYSDGSNSLRNFDRVSSNPCN
jgi:hypothetical protein